MSRSSAISIIDNHPLYPGRQFKLQRTEGPFCCDACDMRGFSFTCYSCEAGKRTFHLHPHCAKAERSLEHPFFKSCRFQLVTHGLWRKGKLREQFCNACGELATGLFYHCYDCGKDLHPSCANLPEVLVDKKLKLELKLKKKLPFGCEKCGWAEKNHGKTSWGYVSRRENVAFHISCMNDLLLDNFLKRKDSSQGRSAVEDGGNKLVKKTPMLQLVVRERKGLSKGKLAKIKKRFQQAVSIILGVLLGDPISLVGVIVTIISLS